MSKPFKMVKGGTHTAEPGTRISRYEKHEKERDISIGFRLVYDHADRAGRGGGWLVSELLAHKANRGNFDPVSRNNALGFRLVRGEGGK